LRGGFGRFFVRRNAAPCFGLKFQRCFNLCLPRLSRKKIRRNSGRSECDGNSRELPKNIRGVARISRVNVDRAARSSLRELDLSRTRVNIAETQSLLAGCLCGRADRVISFRKICRRFCSVLLASPGMTPGRAGLPLLSSAGTRRDSRSLRRAPYYLHDHCFRDRDDHGQASRIPRQSSRNA